MTDCRQAPPDIKPLLAHIGRKAGLSFPAIRRHEIAAGICRLMQKHAIGGVGELIERLDTDVDIFDAVIAETTTGETYFFRDPAQLEAIRTIVLPSLLSNRPSFSPLRIWSAGCSTGEEAYSLSILMEEEGLGERAHILATDISRSALRKARKAKFGPRSLRNDDLKIPERFLYHHGERFQLVERIRKRVRFEFLNLASDSYPSVANGTAGVDLIVCRNVLIYFDGTSIERVANRFFESLGVGGWLVIGPSDPPLWDYAPFKTVITPGGVLYRREDSPAISERQNSTERKPQVVQSPTRLRPKLRSQIGAEFARDPLAEAEAAYAAGNHSRVIQLTKHIDETRGYAPRIRSLYDTGNLADAEGAAEEAAAKQADSPDFIANWEDEAIDVLRRAVYLDLTLAAAFLALGSILQRTNKPAAKRALAHARALCVARPVDDAMPLTGGDTAERLAESAQEHIDGLSALSSGGS
ncbi:protein-glutamate O-methyltransferase CheR [Mesorhizobium sp. M00.F.Ca.ET.216.01.1.1]|uniref:CheR family methyltransferase n=1 Tax=Mesorhizobium sp. M00.F.Ca.ET.216.01.1.1 TaxID=2500528 RepID=UPI000FDC5B05|nr:protein-glutamate O-methyltransferase CheR [Mesorhizobium sp. M00.F.Ca.ET.216.01.1.1]TGQ31053.1 protein-glutamate O-methyltransferase CheR [Mesorhizobium sp. M00.F.Ca.ET.216.01.1.1]TJW04584.1 MAG: protein-glutamate O-methyltransferase CheR [Mesorhizobium sp.]